MIRMGVRAILKNILAGFLLISSFLLIFIVFLYQPLANFVSSTLGLGPYLAINMPAGIEYNGPPTSGLAGYYCIHDASTVNFTIQLNAELGNGLWAQDAWASGNYSENVWGFMAQLSGYSVPNASACGWLVMVIRNGVLYFGYSTDGTHVVWYYKYQVDNTTILPGYLTNLVVAGPGGGKSVSFTSLRVVLALYYWGGSRWLPAPVRVLTSMGTGERVASAWVYFGGNWAVVSWPKPANQSIPVPTPEFKP